MYFATIDCGTTNSRVYVLNDRYEVLAKGTKKVGVRDTAITDSKKTLREGLKEVFEQTVEDAGLKISDIEFAITSGMITSEIGLMEIPHLWAPAGLEELASSMTVVRDDEIFPVDIPLIFIRGIKNYFPENTTYEDIRRIDFMRGEETQVAGLLSMYPNMSSPSTIVVLSSHTKFIHVNKEKKIAGSLTTLSGQTYEAIKKETFIGKSIQTQSSQKADYFDPRVVETAYDCVRNAGFLRTILMPRFMEVLLETEWFERRLFIEAAIVAEDLGALGDFDAMNFDLNCNFILVGHKIRCEILKYLLSRHYGVSSEIRCVFDKEKIDWLSINGAIAIAQKAGYLKEGK